jgi:hypothetical protein
VYFFYQIKDIKGTGTFIFDLFYKRENPVLRHWGHFPLCHLHTNAEFNCMGLQIKIFSSVTETGKRKKNLQWCLFTWYLKLQVSVSFSLFLLRLYLSNCILTISYSSIQVISQNVPSHPSFCNNLKFSYLFNKMCLSYLWKRLHFKEIRQTKEYQGTNGMWEMDPAPGRPRWNWDVFSMRNSNNDSRKRQPIEKVHKDGNSPS